MKTRMKTSTSLILTQLSYIVVLLFFLLNILSCTDKKSVSFAYLIILLILLGKSKEAEIKRINKELANIRSKFKGDKTLDGYQKKKYVCKLLFIFLLGHDIDFGHMEAVNLLSSNKYSEKQIVSHFFSFTTIHTT